MSGPCGLPVPPPANPRSGTGAIWVLADPWDLRSEEDAGETPRALGTRAFRSQTELPRPGELLSCQHWGTCLSDLSHPPAPPARWPGTWPHDVSSFVLWLPGEWSRKRPAEVPSLFPLPWLGPRTETPHASSGGGGAATVNLSRASDSGTADVDAAARN